MTSLTFTADSTTDQLAITGHGLLTGAGPALAFNVGGALAGGLGTALASQFWVIRIDADHIKLADSAAHASAGTAIDITSNGSGTQMLFLGLPYVAPRTYAPSSQVFSADLNALFGASIGNKRAPFWRHYYPAAALQQTNFAFGTNPVNASDPPCWTSTGAGSIKFSIGFEDGDRLLGFKYWAAGNGTADLLGGLLLYSSTFGSAPLSLAGWDDSNRAASWSQIDVAAVAAAPTFAPQDLVQGGTLWVSFPANAAGISLGTFSALFDRR